MKKNPSLKELEDRIDDLCVKTYLEILGYGCYVSNRYGFAGFPALFTVDGMLYVDRRTNQYCFGPGGKPRGGVLEIAALRFGVSKWQVLLNPSRYRIDILLIVRGHIRGAVWTPWSLPGTEPGHPISIPPIPQRLASFFTNAENSSASAF